MQCGEKKKCSNLLDCFGFIFEEGERTFQFLTEKTNMQNIHIESWDRMLVWRTASSNYQNVVQTLVVH